KLYSAIIYILNRLLVALKDWKTLYKIVTSRKPSLAYLHRIGSTTYVYKLGSRAELKKSKLNARALISNLVSFNSGSIYRI
ncbi:hypothetical protein K490DRAFT_52482, partial [Saccharata proteae CBS 121410]